jgi:hypothetical protein
MSSNGEQSMVDFTFHQPPKEREPMAGSRRRLQPEDFQSAAVTFACKTQHDGHRSILFPHNIFSCYLFWIACVSGAARITITTSAMVIVLRKSSRWNFVRLGLGQKNARAGSEY